MRRDKRSLGRARDYAFVTRDYDPARVAVEEGELHFGDFSLYDVHYDRRLGEGAYGEVFLATNRRTARQCVVKTIKPDKADDIRIKREVRFLNLLATHPNIVTLLDLVKDPRPGGLMMLVFEYVQYAEPKELFPHITPEQTRFYLYHTLLAVHHAHSLGIMHRDLKEANVLYDPVRNKLRVIDWGFACFYQPHVKNEKWPGTRYFKSADLFLHYKFYDYSVDMWAFGCMLGSIIFQRSPMFRAKCDDNGAQLIAIGRFLGTDDYARYVRKYRFPYESKYPVKFLRTGGCSASRFPLSHLVTPANQHLASPDAIDLAEKLLVWDHEQRLTAREALDHPYFDPVRMRAAKVSAPAAPEIDEAACESRSYSSTSTWVVEVSDE